LPDFVAYRSLQPDWRAGTVPHFDGSPLMAVRYGDEAMKLLVGVLALAALASAATAANAQTPQQSQMNNAANVGRHASDANKTSDDPKVKANDKAYSQALRNLPDKQFDPWRGVR
jgi:hypothetical protein